MYCRLILALLLTVSCLSAAVLPDVSGVTGAVLDESTIVRTYTVDGAAGTDSNPGSSTQPFATIKAAFSQAKLDLRAGTPTRIRIRPGTYRESLGYWNTSTNASEHDTLLVIEATAPGVTISGSRLIPAAEFTRRSDGVFFHPWVSTLPMGSPPGQGLIPEVIGHRREMVFIDGEPLMQRLLDIETYDDASRTYAYSHTAHPGTRLWNGTFGVITRDPARAGLHLRSETGRLPSDARIEVAERDTFLSISGKRRMVVRGLTFTHFAGGHQAGSYNILSPLGFAPWGTGPIDVLIEDCRFRWNNGPGFHWKQGERLTLRRNEAHFNGFNGIHGGTTANVLFEDNTVIGNNWRGEMGGKTGWYLAGTKVHSLRGAIFRRHTAIGNRAPGLWFDIHNKHVLIERLVSVGNLNQGLFLEISAGPFLVDRCLIAANDNIDFLHYTVGDCTVRDTIIHGTHDDGDDPSCNLFWYPRPGNEHWELDPFEPGTLTMLRNCITGGTSAARLLRFAHNLNKPAFRENYRASDNRYFHASGSSAARFAYGNWGSTIGDFAGYTAWQGARELRPAWGDPRFIDPDAWDFRLAAGSPLADRADVLPVQRIADHYRNRVAELSRFQALASGPRYARVITVGALPDHTWTAPQPADAVVGPVRDGAQDIGLPTAAAAVLHPLPVTAADG